jgi:hypothetical protein
VEAIILSIFLDIDRSKASKVFKAVHNLVNVNRIILSVSLVFKSRNLISSWFLERISGTTAKDTAYHKIKRHDPKPMMRVPMNLLSSHKTRKNHDGLLYLLNAFLIMIRGGKNPPPISHFKKEIDKGLFNSSTIFPY